MNNNRISISIEPENSMQILSRHEVEQLHGASQSSLYPLFRCCALAVLNCGSGEDDTTAIMQEYHDFDIKVIEQSRGIQLEVINAPAYAFVGDTMIRGIKEHLFAVLRDVVFIGSEIINNKRFDLDTSSGTTDAVFEILRNAGVLMENRLPKLVVCWGGHSISREEYDYSKVVGYELGLRGLDICTGCGPGAMKGPMKGAALGHAKQRIKHGRFIGITEPGIIAAESPNPIVNELVIMPDIEKRLEGFVRLAHSIIIFPGGAGTAEEILYLLGLLLEPENRHNPLPLILTAPNCSKNYFKELDAFIMQTLGKTAQLHYRVIIGNPKLVAQQVAEQMQVVENFRKAQEDAFYFNWCMKINHEFQSPFEPTHEHMAQLNLHKNQPEHLLAANLRRVFSGVVAGNVKESGINAINQHGPFEISGDQSLMQALDNLLQSFAAQKRMKLNSQHYQPCYRIVR